MLLEEIKIRQLTNQYLLEPADKYTVVRGLCGVQAQFMVHALHSLKIRTTDYDEATVGDGLVKNWTIRGTVHVFAESDLPVFMHCNNGADYRRRDWGGYSYRNPQGQWQWALTPERQKVLAERILAALEDSARTRDELKEVCRKNGMTPLEEASMFDQWGGGIRELCERGFINYTVQEKAGKKEYCLSPDFVPIPEDTAKLEIARRYFTHMAPATVRDAAYFFGTTQAQVKKWLSSLPVASAECNGKTYFYIENGKSYDQDIPDCLFLAGFDQLMLGYEKKESLYLPPLHRRAIFNLAGIVMPAVLLYGEVVGRWKRKNRKVTVELFSGLGQAGISVIKEKAMTVWADISQIEIQ